MRPVSRVLLGAAWLLMGLAPAGADEIFEQYQNLYAGRDHLSDADTRTMADLRRSERPGDGGLGLSGMVNGPGSVTFSYGSSRPMIICALLELCDIALEEGEGINSVQIGDSARWQVSTAVSGEGGSRVQHLIVKPLDSGLRTSMIIATDRRTYHLQLKSTFDEFMPQVSFIYPGEDLQRLNDNFGKVRRTGQHPANPKAGGGRSGERLNFDYECDGDEEIMPERVYHDGQKTYIDMKSDLYARRTPALLIVSKRGGWFGSDREHVANYRIQGHRYIIDGVLQEARLILGEGGENYSVEISYKGS